ncbi:LysR substrate-binding domain-containing protein [Roseomonas sp. E05]|uniref:LysR substrate-binding domain-containing protein n=1 Tax=Roseomonas sp. E05 TaxID=3046310 RepID=UPI0024BA1FCE|nr:LysR substrate-binding domain-containing protein [Roseomonas sp. E05]MDJ0388365.1 LysR substrate-binding domain-containing protein [Roseomonas sp. E05]
MAASIARPSGSQCPANWRRSKGRSAASRSSSPAQAALVAKHLGMVRIGLFAHRDYAARRGLPRTREELAGFALIGPDRAPSDLRLVAALAPALSHQAFALRTDSHPAQFAAVRAGLGIGPVHLALGQRAPGLVRVLPGFLIHGFETWIVMHEDPRRVARIRAVFDHLAGDLARYVAAGEEARPAAPP